MIERELLQRALDALTLQEPLAACVSEFEHWRRTALPTVGAIRAHLAQPPAEPVAWRFTHNRGNGKTAFTFHDSDDYATAYRDTCLETTPLYTATPSPAHALVPVIIPLSLSN